MVENVKDGNAEVQKTPVEKAAVSLGIGALKTGAYHEVFGTKGIVPRTVRLSKMLTDTFDAEETAIDEFDRKLGRDILEEMIDKTGKLDNVFIARAVHLGVSELETKSKPLEAQRDRALRESDDKEKNGIADAKNKRDGAIERSRNKKNGVKQTESGARKRSDAETKRLFENYLNDAKEERDGLVKAADDVRDQAAAEATKKMNETIAKVKTDAEAEQKKATEELQTLEKQLAIANEKKERLKLDTSDTSDAGRKASVKAFMGESVALQKEIADLESKIGKLEYAADAEDVKYSVDFETSRAKRQFKTEMKPFNKAFAAVEQQAREATKEAIDRLESDAAGKKSDAERKYKEAVQKAKDADSHDVAEAQSNFEQETSKIRQTHGEEVDAAKNAFETQMAPLLEKVKAAEYIAQGKVDVFSLLHQVGEAEAAQGNSAIKNHMQVLVNSAMKARLELEAYTKGELSKSGSLAGLRRSLGGAHPTDLHDVIWILDEIADSST